MPVQWTITVRHQAMEILRGERGKNHSSLKLWLLCFCSCILSLLQQLLDPFSFVIFLSRQIKGPGDTKWHAKSDTGKEMCKRWWICSLENDGEKNHNVFMPYSISSKPGYEFFLVNHRILHGILGFLGTWVSAILVPNSCKLWGSVLGINLSRKCSKDLFFASYFFSVMSCLPLPTPLHFPLLSSSNFFLFSWRKIFASYWRYSLQWEPALHQLVWSW